jgi:hypothetical protein
MAIKKVTFSFDVPITQLLGLIASGNAAMKIDVYGDDKSHAMNGKHLTGPKVAGLLEAPKRSRGGGKNKGGVTAYEMIARAILADPGHRLNTGSLRPAFEKAGFSKNSISPQTHLMYSNGYLKRMANGEYIMTAAGFKHFKQRGYTADAVAKDAPKNEADHG